MIQGAVVGVIIAAAGSGTRMGGSKPKQLIEIGGKPILFHTLRRFEKAASVDNITIATTEENLTFVEEVARQFPKVVSVIRGGRHRQDSVWNGLQALRHRAPDLVLVHDAVRPFVQPQAIDGLAATAAATRAAILAVRAKDSIKLADEHQVISASVDRNSAWLAQTPQGFAFELLHEAFERAIKDQFYGTDESSLVERIGVKVTIIEGSYENIKVTTPDDLELARQIYNKVTETP